MKKIVFSLMLLAGIAYADTGDIPLSSNFQENSGRPLDARITVSSATTRLALPSTQVYDGMMVYQRSDQTTWQLQGSTYTWVEIIPSTSTSGSSMPAAPFNSVQFNSTGTFNGSSNFTTDGSSVTVSTIVVNNVATALGPINAQDGIVMGASSASNAGNLDWWTSPSPTAQLYSRMLMTNSNLNSGPNQQRYKAGWNFEDASGNVKAYISAVSSTGGNLTLNTTGQITLYDGPTSHFVALISSNTNTASYNMIFPGGPTASTNTFVNVSAINGQNLNLNFFDLYDSSPMWTGQHTFQNTLLITPINRLFSILPNAIMAIENTDDSAGSEIYANGNSGNVALYIGQGTGSGTVNLQDSVVVSSQGAGNHNSGNLTVAYNVNAGSMTGAGLSSCSGGSNALTWSSSTNQFGCNTISGGGSGASTLGVAKGQVLVSSPTALISFDSNTLNVALQGGATAFVSINTSSITAQGNFYSLSGLAASTGTLTTAIASLAVSTTAIAASTTTLGTSITNIALSTTTLETQINTKINFSSITATQPAFWNSGTGVISVSGVSLSTGVIGQLPAASIAAGALGSGVIASSLTASGVTAGSYTNTNLTVNAEGQITNASNGSGGGSSGIVSPGTFTWTNNFGLSLSTLALTNAAQRNTLVISTATNGISEVTIDSNGLANFQAIISTPNAFTLKNPSGNTIFSVDNSSISATDVVLTISSVTSGGTPIATFQANGNVSIPSLTSGQCVQAGSGGLLATTGSACGSGGSGVPSINADSNGPITSSVTLISGTNITLNQLGNTISVNSSGGGGSPGGSNTQVQYNNSGSFGGDPNMQVWASSETHTGAGGLGITYGLQGSTVTLTQNNLRTGTTDGLLLANTTASTSGATVQNSPALHLQGHAWKSNVTATDQELDFTMGIVANSRPAGGEAQLRFLPTVGGTVQAGLSMCSGASAALQQGTFLVNIDGGSQYNCDSGVGFSGIGPVGASGTWGIWNNSTETEIFSTAGTALGGTKKIYWTAAANPTNSVSGDIALVRNAAGVLEVDNGTSGVFAQLITSTQTFYGPIVSSGTAPTVSSCGSTPNGSVSGTNTAGVITLGGGVVTSCTLNFANAGFLNPPVCVVSDNSTTVSSSNGTITSNSAVFNTSATLSGGLLYYICMGTRI